MEHKGTKVLTSNRLELRPLCVADAHAMYLNWASDPDVTKFLTWPVHANEEVTKTLLAEWVTHYEEPTYYQWGIVVRSTNDLIGTIGVVSMNEAVDSVHMGYCIGKNWWHQGIMSEALNMMMSFFFEEVKAKRIDSRHDINNPNSGLVMKKCGMKYEGCLRQSDVNNQGIVDTAHYGILSSEYSN